MSRNKIDPTHSLGQFIYGIFDYYYDRGMPQKTAKARMIDSTLETCVKIMRKEEEIPDQMLVLMAQWMSRALNDRGATISRSVSNKKQVNTESLKTLTDIKEVKDVLDKFIENYKGWSDTHGKEN